MRQPLTDLVILDPIEIECHRRCALARRLREIAQVFRPIAKSPDHERTALTGLILRPHQN